MPTVNPVRAHQFAYFDEQLGHPDWASATVLDFGGNAGSILLEPLCPIAHRNYWCVDLSRDAVTLGEAWYPDAHFVHCDRYNFELNPSGRTGLPFPELGVRFDIILVYSAFTHASRGELRTLIAWLRSLLTEHGVLAFTFVDPDFNPPESWVRANEPSGLDNLLWCLTISPGTAADAVELATRARRNPMAWITLVNQDELVVDPGDAWVHKGQERSGYFVLCTERHMRSLYPDATILPPVRPHRRSCCVLRRTATEERR